MERLYAFLNKTRRRGWSYARAVGAFYARRGVYRAGRGLGEVIRGMSPSLYQSRSPLARSGRFHFTWEDIPRIVSRVPQALRQRTIAAAEPAGDQRFNFRDIGERMYLGQVNWTERADGNISWQWDLNRHRHFVTLGLAYHYTDEREFLRALTRQWESWLRENPAGRGCNWMYPFEVAARLQNWIWAWFLLKESCLAGEERLERLERAMSAHARFLYWNLEYHWPNNHLLLEAKALAAFALLFPGFDRSGRYLRRSVRVLEREVRAQVLEDGVHSELCPMYHRIVAGELAEFAKLCERNKILLPADVTERIDKMQEFSQAMVRDDGSTPLLGDSALEDSCLRFEPARPEQSDMTYWAGLCASGRGERRDEQWPVQVFAEAGYAFLRKGRGNEETQVVFDFGPFSRCPASDHGHADALSFELYARGRGLLIDPGAYFPSRDGHRWRQYFRSTRAHNTLVIDGREQTELWRHSDVKRTATARLVASDGENVRVTAECAPFWAEDAGIRHRREVRLAEAELQVHDLVVGPGRHHLAWHFHFAPEVRLGWHQGAIEAFDGDGVLVCALEARSRTPLKVSVVRGQQQPLQGWVSRNSAQVEPGFVAVYEAEAELPCQCEFRIRIAKVQADCRRPETGISETADSHR